MTVLIFLSALLAAMLIGIPIAYALLLSSVALMMQMDLFDTQILAQNIINGADSFPLLAIPFFMLAGEVMNAGGLSKRLVQFAMTLVGHKRGGLGYVVVVTGCLMAALSGSAVADAAALTALLLPMMVRAGHDKAISSGLIASASVIAPVLPPSIAFIIFGVAANVSIGKLFVAGIVPGLLMGVAIAVAWTWVVRRETVPLPPKASLREQGRAFREALWALMLPVIILVGLRMGVFTPTEAAVVAAVYSLFVSCVIYRELKLNSLYAIFASAARTTAIVMFLIAAAMVAAWLITVADIPGHLISVLDPFMDNPTLLLIAIMFFILVVGMAMEMMPIILIFTPVLMPVIKQAGIDPAYFGVLLIINTSISLITPPVGSVLNVVSGVSQMKMEHVARGVFPFLIAQMIVLALLVLFPSIVIVPMEFMWGR